MRKHQQKQILELLETLKSLQGAGLYADCQEGAISIGEFIEELEGEGTQTVELLEEYCDLLYQASIGENVTKALNKQLTRIENSVRSELKPNRIEMVFLSYNASMSDCLESIYFTAKEDPNCDVYWIPIPYYELNPDGSLGAMRYEGQENYKSSIECTDWREYDIEERHPDVIFTFSPYDDDSYVTRIHPDFYCVRLRNLTDMLVYVPYYVTSGTVREPYTKCAGVVYSHLVVVQSESVRQDFIRDCLALEEIGYDQNALGAPKKKIVALGSPKFDAVINAKPSDFALPDKWKNLIEKPDGTKKKVILFITSINASFNNGSQYLKKLIFILDEFSKRDDVVLWWRPHPLGRTAFAKAYPELIDTYDKKVEEYKNGGWGIYDDTPDLHRAIAFSDAYYGDNSSVVILYQVTGKPIMISNPEIMHSIPKFEPTSIYVNKDKIWFTVRYINALFYMAKDDCVLKLAGSVPGEVAYIPASDYSLYLTPVEYNNKLYFPPFSANEIAVFDLHSEKFSKVRYNREKTQKNKNDFSDAILYGSNIYFIPHGYPGILRLCTESMEMSYIVDWLEPLNNITGNPQTHFYRACLVDSSIWAPSLESNAVLQYDIKENKCSIYEVGEKHFRYISISFDGANFWLSPLFGNNMPITKWHPIKGVKNEFGDIYSENNTKGFLAEKHCGDYIWFIPIFDGDTYKIDFRTDDAYVVKELSFSVDDNQYQSSEYLAVDTFSDSIYIYSNNRSTLIEYNCITNKHREETVYYSSEIFSILEKLYSEAFTAAEENGTLEIDCYFKECDGMLLSSFLSYIVNTSNENESKKQTLVNNRTEHLSVNTNGTSGKVIYDYVKKKVPALS
ncbi:MAG: hypothetical protein FWE83_01210 [Oscillospiraceae bacterium]|nr:hypothetical protein [Oscillospiraceae bacterium]